MTVYVDDFRVRATVGRLTAQWSHLFAAPGEDLEELHRFAGRLGLRREAGLILTGRKPTGMINIRVAGEQADLEPMITLLREHADLFRVRGPRDNQADPGVRFYIQMTMRPA